MVKQRNEAIYNLYKKIWRENPSLSYDEVIHRILDSPQPRMWTSFWGVYRMLLRIVKNKKCTPKWASRARQEDEVWRKYQRLKKQPIFRDASIYFLSAFIIAEPSRGFYVSPIYAKRIIWKTSKKHRKNGHS